MFENEAHELSLAKDLFGKKPQKNLKIKLENLFANLKKEENIDLSNPPSINQYSDYKLWLSAVEHIEQPDYFEELALFPLRENEKECLFLVWSKSELIEDTHLDCVESILLLEGTCDFYANNTIMHYEAGTFIQVPDSDHTVKVTSEIPLKFIVQRVFQQD